MLNDLYDEPIDLDDPDVAELSELDGRRAMIRLWQLERDIEKTKKTKKAVAEEYDRRLDSLDREKERVRQTLRALVTRFGKISFPDVGTAFERRVDPKIEVVDKEAFERELGAMFRKDSFDETAAKNFALEQALDDGVIIPGTELVPAGHDITVRKA